MPLQVTVVLFKLKKFLIIFFLILRKSIVILLSEFQVMLTELEYYRDLTKEPSRSTIGVPFFFEDHEI